jgi:protein-tyrosine phosphatase
VVEEDFERFQLILAMDDDNLSELERLRPGPQALQPGLLMDFARRHAGQRAVPDPYYGGPDGFDRVLDLVDDACDGLLEELRRRLAGAADGTS